MMSLHGHYWTLVPHVAKALMPPEVPLARHFAVSVSDQDLGVVRLTGRLSEVPGATRLVVVVHGLGGSAHSKYVFETARAAVARGYSVLRLNLRGADRLGHDYYHAGQAEDLTAALESPELSRYHDIHLVGWSIGGHVALRYLQGDRVDPRVRSAAILCAPLDLEATATCFDRGRGNVYRSHVLSGLKEMYRAVARYRNVPLSVQEASRIRRMRKWDGAIVAPRYGFGSASEYYAEVSAGPHMSRIETPTLLVATRSDPMVPEDTVRPSLRSASAAIDIRWLAEGGHVGFPKATSLGEPGELGLEPQVLSWLIAHTPR